MKLISRTTSFAMRQPTIPNSTGAIETEEQRRQKSSAPLITGSDGALAFAARIEFL